MNTLLRFASIGLFLAAPLFTACGDGEDVDLDSIPVVTTDDEKSDKPGSPTFFWVRPQPGPIACIRPPCPTAQVRQVNVSDVQAIYKFDYRGLKLSSTDQATLDAGRSSMLLYGKYTSATAYKEQVTVFQVTRANQLLATSGFDDIENDKYYSVKATTVPCTGGTCAQYEAAMLGNFIVGPVQLLDIDLGRLQLPAPVAAALASEFKAGTDFISVSDITAKVANATQAFRPFGAAQLR